MFQGYNNELAHNLRVKYNIQVAYVRRRLTVNGALKRFSEDTRLISK
jgi:hypothetical protein